MKNLNSLFLTPPNNNKKNPISSAIMYSNISPLPGLELGIPIQIFENIFTNLHYGHDIELPFFFIISCLIGYVTYGTDRFLDALEYENSKFIDFSKSKVQLYNYILNNKKFILNTLLFSNIILITIFRQQEETLPFIPLLALSNFYKNIKQYNGLLKAPFIGFMWTIASIILPCVMHDHNYDIINDPSSYLPAFLSLIASSNLADIVDYEEDKNKNIETIPVKFGKENAIYLNLILIFISSLIFAVNKNFLNRPIINSFFELNNFGTSLANFRLSNDTVINDYFNL